MKDFVKTVQPEKVQVEPKVSSWRCINKRQVHFNPSLICLCIFHFLAKVQEVLRKVSKSIRHIKENLLAKVQRVFMKDLFV